MLSKSMANWERHQKHTGECWQFVGSCAGPLHCPAGLTVPQTHLFSTKSLLVTVFCCTEQIQFLFFLSRRKDVFSPLTQLDEALSFILTAFLSCTASLVTQTTSSCGKT